MNLCLTSSPALRAKLARTGLYLIVAASLNGCAALAVSLAGAGAGAGISHQVNGMATRTFSEPMPKLDTALILASKRMEIQVDTMEATGNMHTMKGRISDLDITVDMESLSGNMTRIDVTARKNLFRVDSATAQEIVAQIEKALLTPNAKVAENKEAVLENARGRKTTKPKAKSNSEI